MILAFNCFILQITSALRYSLSRHLTCYFFFPTSYVYQRQFNYYSAKSVRKSKRHDGKHEESTEEIGQIYHDMTCGEIYCLALDALISVLLFVTLMYCFILITQHTITLDTSQYRMPLHIPTLPILLPRHLYRSCQRPTNSDTSHIRRLRHPTLNRFGCTKTIPTEFLRWNHVHSGK